MTVNQGIDGHISKYDTNWIRIQHRPETRIEPTLWVGTEKQNDIPTASYNDTDEQVAKTLTKSLLEFGIGLVKDVRIQNSVIKYFKINY